MEPEFRRFRASDAEAVIATFRTVYGDEYPVDFVYQPDYWVRQDQLYTYVASCDDGGVAGLVSFYRVAPFGGLFECGQLAVAPDWRKARLGKRLVRYALDSFVGEPVVQGIFAEMGCHWTVSQHMFASLDFQECAFAVELLGSETYAREHDVDQRTSAIVSYFDVRDRSQTLFVAPEDRPLLDWIYSGFSLQRQFAEHGQPLAGQSAIHKAYLAQPRLGRLDFSAVGADFEACLQESEIEFQQQGAALVQLRLPLEDPGCVSARRLAGSRGYRVCGLLPRWFDGDGLLLQLNWSPPDFSRDQIATERGRILAERIQHQWK